MVRILLYRIFIIALCVSMVPIAAVIAIGIIIFSGSPVLFRQQRVGKGGKIFTMYKFRTMAVGAEQKQQKYLSKNEANGPVFKIRNDPRFTPIGKLLSHSGLDELAQLYNVLIGDMSLIGPRPLPVLEAKKLNSWQKKRQEVNPGIISPWVLDGYHKKTFDEWMKSDIEYIKNKSLYGDFRLFVASMRFMIQLFVITYIIGDSSE